MPLDQIASLDTSILLSILSLRSAPLDIFFSAITQLGSLFFLFLIGLALLAKDRKAGAKFLFGFAINLAVIFFLKQFFLRPRPFEVLQNIIPLDTENSSSFPSGHSANAFFGASLLSQKYKKFSIAFYLIAILIAFSRIYAGVHYPTDVLFGAVEGFLFGRFWIKNFDFDKLRKKFFH